MYMEIRDKLFTEEQYLSQLKLYNEEILYYEQLHRSGKHIGYDSNNFHIITFQIFKVLSYRKLH